MNRDRRWRNAAWIAVALVAFATGWFGYQQASQTVLRSVLAQENEDRLDVAEEVAFDRFPLFWLGLEYDTGSGPLPLTEVIARSRPGYADHPGYERVDFLYGTCEITQAELEQGEDSCPVPLQVTVYPHCGPDLDLREPVVRERVNRGDKEYIVYTQGHVFVKMPAARVIVISSDENDADGIALKAASRLSEANELAKQPLDAQRDMTRACP
jgi:hypothetical protein